MKVSRFAFMYINPANDILFINTLYRSVIKFDRSYLRILRKIFKKIRNGTKAWDTLSSTENEIVRLLYEQRIFVDDEENEMNVLMEYYRAFEEGVLVIKVFLTNDCNFACRYCYQRHLKKYMTLQVAKNVVKFIKHKVASNKNLRVVYLTFFGGEPLLNEGILMFIIEKVSYILKANNIQLEVLIVTNGSLLNTDSIQQIASFCRKLYIQVTIDGSDKRHDLLRPFSNGAPSWHLITGNIRKMDEKLSVDNVHVIYRMNIDDSFTEKDKQGLYIPRRLEYSLSMVGIFEDPSKGEKEDKTMQNSKLALIYLKAAKDMGLKIEDTLENPLFSCSVGLKNTFTVNSDGSLVICTGVNPDDPQNIYGYIDQNGNEIILNKKLYNKLFSVNFEFYNLEPCKNCKFLPICFGGCAYSRKIKRNIPSCPPLVRHMNEFVNTLL